VTLSYSRFSFLMHGIIKAVGSWNNCHSPTTGLFRKLEMIYLYINNCPTKCNTNQSIYYTASSLYMFRVSTTPNTRSTHNCNCSLRYCAATSFQRGQATLEGGSCTVPEAAVTVVCAPGVGCGWHPKHVEWTCSIINRLICIASRWTIINIDQLCTEP